jgi:hypothetical protein
MADRPMYLAGVFRPSWGNVDVDFFALVLVLYAALATDVRAAQATTSGPSVQTYMREAGPDAKLVGHGMLKIDGKSVNCGTRPTVLNPNFNSWAGAFPGFMILNTKKLDGLSTPVKLFLYSHECGHQFVGVDEVKADFFAIRRGMRLGWLNARGMKDICTFISKLKATAAHPPGPARCEMMRKYYERLIKG